MRIKCDHKKPRLFEEKNAVANLTWNFVISQENLSIQNTQKDICKGFGGYMLFVAFFGFYGWRHNSSRFLLTVKIEI